MSKEACMVYPSGSLHSYEQALSESFKMRVYASYAPSETTLFEFGSVFTPLSKKIDNGTINRYVYSFWHPPKEYDTVVSSRFIGKEVRTDNHQRHIHLAHGIHRGAFGLPPRTQFSDNRIVSILQKANRLYLRRREYELLVNTDFLVVNSEFTAELMNRYHNIKPDRVIYPPIQTNKYYNCRPCDEDFYLYVGRLDRIKRVEEIIRTFNKLERSLVVAGKGELESKLKKIAGDNIRFEGYVSEYRKRELFSKCNGFIQNTLAEDFGMTTVEALASGAPVIAVNDGNNPNLINDGKNGVLFQRPGSNQQFQIENSINKLAIAVEKAETVDWDYSKIQLTANKYDISTFRQRWETVLEL